MGNRLRDGALPLQQEPLHTLLLWARRLAGRGHREQRDLLQVGRPVRARCPAGAVLWHLRTQPLERSEGGGVSASSWRRITTTPAWTNPGRGLRNYSGPMTSFT